MNTANLRKLLDEATPRPWVHEDGSYWIRDPAQPEYIGLVECHDSAMNAALIVELVNSADELLAENDRLRAALLFIRDKEQAALNEAESLRLNIPEDAGCMEILHTARKALAENERLRLERQELIDSVAAIRQQQKEKEWPVTGGLVTALEQKA